MKIELRIELSSDEVKAAVCAYLENAITYRDLSLRYEDIRGDVAVCYTAGEGVGLEVRMTERVEATEDDS